MCLDVSKFPCQIMLDVWLWANLCHYHDHSKRKTITKEHRIKIQNIMIQKVEYLNKKRYIWTIYPSLVLNLSEVRVRAKKIQNEINQNDKQHVKLKKNKDWIWEETRQGPIGSSPRYGWHFSFGEMTGLQIFGLWNSGLCKWRSRNLRSWLPVVPKW